MGAWGAGSFENDTAMDWAGSVRSLADVGAPFERLKALMDADGNIAGLLEADLASELVAAAETVAMLMGRVSPDFPDSLREQLADAGKPDDQLFHRARNALWPVLRSSELAELWQEAAVESGVNEWNAAISGLIERLNPEIEFEPWPQENAERQVGRAVGACAFCDQPVARDELWGMTLYDATDVHADRAGLWFHLPCLNARLHHRHAIFNLKFDPDNLPDPDQV